jgi:hypothetical protein
LSVDRSVLVSGRPLNSSLHKSTPTAFPPAPLLFSSPPGILRGTGHHHNSVFSRTSGIQSAVESTSPRSGGATSSCQAKDASDCAIRNYRRMAGTMISFDIIPFFTVSAFLDYF